MAFSATRGGSLCGFSSSSHIASMSSDCFYHNAVGLSGSNHSSPPSTALPSPPLSPRYGSDPSLPPSRSPLSPIIPKLRSAAGYTVSRASTEDSADLCCSSQLPAILHPDEKERTVREILQQSSQRGVSASLSSCSSCDSANCSCFASGFVSREGGVTAGPSDKTAKTVSTEELRRLLREILAEFQNHHPMAEVNVAQVLQQLLEIRNVDLTDLHEPSLGALLHEEGHCKPCVFANKNSKVCHNGRSCYFCHHYHKERRRRSKKIRKQGDIISTPPVASPSNNRPLRIPPPPCLPPPPPPLPRSSRVSYRTARPTSANTPVSTSSYPLYPQPHTPSSTVSGPPGLAEQRLIPGCAVRDAFAGCMAEERVQEEVTSMLLKELAPDVLLKLQQAIEHAVDAACITNQGGGAVSSQYDSSSASSIAGMSATGAPEWFEAPYAKYSGPPQVGIQDQYNSFLHPPPGLQAEAPGKAGPNGVSVSRSLTTASSIESSGDFYTFASSTLDAVGGGAANAGGQLAPVAPGYPVPSPATSTGYTRNQTNPIAGGVGALEPFRRCVQPAIYRTGGHYLPPGSSPEPPEASFPSLAGTTAGGAGLPPRDPYNSPTFAGGDTSLASLLLSPSFISFLSSS